MRPAVHASTPSVTSLICGENRRASRPADWAVAVPSAALPPMPYSQAPDGESAGRMSRTVMRKANRPYSVRPRPRSVVGAARSSRRSCRPRSAMARPAMSMVSPRSSLTSTSGAHHRAQARQRRSTKAAEAQASMGTAKAISWNWADTAPWKPQDRT